MRRAAAALAACALVAPALAGAQRHAWQPGDRLLIGALGDLRAVALSPRHVYAAGPAGIVVYDLLRDEWAPPLPLTEGFPLGERPTALAYDPVTDALWLGTADGALFNYTLGFDRWDRIGPVAAGPIAALVAASDALYIATRGGWLRLERGSFLPQPIPQASIPADIRAAAVGPAERDPALAAARGTLGLDPAMRRFQLTDAAAGDRPGEYWIATGGGGLIRYDSRRAAAEWLPIGLGTRGAGAVTVTDDRIWFGGDGRSTDGGGVAAATSDLTRWWHFAGEDGAPRVRVADIVEAHGFVWFGAADGLYRLELDRVEGNRRGWLRLTTVDGLPDARVTSIAPARGGIFVATLAGVAFVRADGSVASVTLARGRQVGRVLVAADTVWVATDGGLFTMQDAEPPAESARRPALVPAPGSDRLPPLRGPVSDVAIAGEALYVLTSAGLYRRDARGWSGPDRTALASVGRPLRLDGFGDTLWIAGEAGAAALDATTAAWIDYLVPADVPAGPVLDIAHGDGVVWLATPAGALRLRLR